MDRLLNQPDAEPEDGREPQTQAPPPSLSVTAARQARVLSLSNSPSPREQLAVQVLPALASQLSAAPSARPSVRLPPITLLTAAASALQPAALFPVQPPLQPRPIAASTAASAAARAAALVVEPDQLLLCRYRNKKCALPRAIKRNGERHNLCEKHRAKANQNQRKLESKRRTHKRLLARLAQQQSPIHQQHEPLAKERALDAFDPRPAKVFRGTLAPSLCHYDRG